MPNQVRHDKTIMLEEISLNPKTPNTQISKIEIVSDFEFWLFGIVWNLEFRAWNL